MKKIVAPQRGPKNFGTFEKQAPGPDRSLDSTNVLHNALPLSYRVILGLVSFAAVFRDVTQRSPERKFLSGERCVTSRKTAAKEAILGFAFSKKEVLGSCTHP